MKVRVALPALLFWLTACTRSEPDAREIAAPRASAPVASSAPRAVASASMAAAPSAAPAMQLDPAARAAAEKYVITLELVAKLFFDHAKSCDDLAKALEGATREKDALRESSTALAHEAASTDDALRQRLDDASRRIADGSMSCSTSKPFARARTKLFAQ